MLKRDGIEKADFDSTLRMTSKVSLLRNSLVANHSTVQERAVSCLTKKPSLVSIPLPCFIFLLIYHQHSIYYFFLCIICLLPLEHKLRNGRECVISVCCPVTTEHSAQVCKHPTFTEPHRQGMARRISNEWSWLILTTALGNRSFVPSPFYR